MSSLALEPLHPKRNNRRRTNRARRSRRFRFDLELLEGRITPTTVTGLSPSLGPETGGTMVTITGTDFTGVTAVDFGLTAAASEIVQSPTSILARSPPGTGPVDVTVTATSGISPTNPNDVFTYVAAPTVTGISPAVGPAAGGTVVTITGSGFTDASAVQFGTTPATDPDVVNDTSITVDSPAGTGTVDVTVTTPGGTSATVARRSIHLLRRRSRASARRPVRPGGGTLVTITGTGFTGATAVDFGAAAATNVTVVDATTITADSPAGTGTVDVTVTTPGGTSATSPADQFTYVAAPTVTGVSPTSGPAAGGTLVTITGTGFTGATAVEFGATPATRRDGGQRHDDHGRQPGRHRHGGRDRDHPGRDVGHLVRRSVHLRRGADGLGRQPGLRSGGRRHVGDDHRDRLHRRHGGRLRHDAGDERDRRQRHLDHGRQPGGHRHGGRDRDDAGRHVGHRRPPISSPTWRRRSRA